jgi:hypothetical protein
VNDDELKQLQVIGPRDPVIRLDDVPVLRKRTLLSGTTAQGTGMHVYFKDDLIHRLRHRDGRVVEYAAADSWTVHRLTDGVMVRPEYTDFYFAHTLIRKGARIDFLPYIEGLYQAALRQDFHAPLREELP